MTAQDVANASGHAPITTRDRWVRWIPTYVAAVDVAALLFVFTTLPTFPQHQWTAFALFLSAIILSDSCQVFMPVSGTITLAFTPMFAATVLFGPAFGALAACIGAMVAHGVVRRKGALKTVFEGGQTAIMVATTGLVFSALRSAPGASLTANAGAYVAAALAFIVVNGMLASGVFALHGRPFWRTWLMAMREGGVFFLAMVPLGALVANAYLQSPWTLLYFPLLLWVLHKGFSLYDHLRSDTDKALVLLADTLDKRDTYTYEHSKRVADHAERIAIALGLPTDMVELIVSAAHIHDLGKISIDNRILFKEGKLTEEERRQINKHPAAGAALAGQFNLFGAGADIIMHHHERWDGTGYPEGLSGEDIPLGSRIIAVADVYDAMTSDRPYRAALSHDVAIAELASGAGTQFDARCVEAFLSLDRERTRAARPTGSVYAHA